MVEQGQCNRLAQHASDYLKHNAVPLLADNATAKQMVKLKQVITAKNGLSKSMQATLGATIQKVNVNKQPLEITEDERMNEQMESAMMEMNTKRRSSLK